MLKEKLSRFSYLYEKNPNLYRRRIDPTPLGYVRWAVMLMALGYMWYARYQLFDMVKPYLYGPLSWLHYWLFEAIALAMRILPVGFFDMALPSAVAWWIYTLTRKPSKGVMIGLFAGILYLTYLTPPTYIH
jgi:hypothetical protein